MHCPCCAWPSQVTTPLCLFRIRQGAMHKLVALSIGIGEKCTASVETRTEEKYLPTDEPQPAITPLHHEQH